MSTRRTSGDVEVADRHAARSSRKKSLAKMRLDVETRCYDPLSRHPGEFVGNHQIVGRAWQNVHADGVRGDAEADDPRMKARKALAQTVLLSGGESRRLGAELAGREFGLHLFSREHCLLSFRIKVLTYH